MGGLGVSTPQYFYINNQNPALLVSPMPGAHNKLTIFEAGVVGETRAIASDTSIEKTKGGNLNYLIMAFPIKPERWVSSLAISPFSTVKYKARYVTAIENSSTEAEITEEGRGGITQLSWANGIRLHERINVGFKASYFFGSITNSYQNKLLDTSLPNNLSASYDDKTYVRDFGFSAGISYSQDSLFRGSRYRLTFGATYDLGTDLNAKRRTIFYRTNNSGDATDLDTIANVRGQYSVPSGFSGGLTISQVRGRRLWNAGIEASFRDWSMFKSFDADEEAGYGKAWRYVAGGEITPDPYSENYLKRITYRLGISYEQTPYRVNTSTEPDSPIYNPVTEFGTNFGLSLPAGRSSLDIGLRYGQRGNKADTFFQETYWRVFFGITFNDQWFVQRKFD